MNTEQVHELLYQALETELGGVQVYAAALRCVSNDDLRKEWGKYHEQTTEHLQIVTDILNTLGLDPNAQTPGRAVVGHIGKSLVAAMELALDDASADAAELVACECVALAETKDHLNWELIGEVGKRAKGDLGKTLRDAYKKVEDQEDEHLYHTAGWGRELWISSLGMPAVLPRQRSAKR